MKSTIISFLVILLIGIGTLGESLQAQTYKNPNNESPYYWYSSTPDNNAVWRGKIDTTATLKLGGVSQLTAVIKSTDTMKADIYFDYLLRNRSSWSVAYTDSFIAVKDTVFEYTLRSSTVERIGGLARAVRGRIYQHPTANHSPSDYDSTSTYFFEWIWTKD